MTWSLSSLRRQLARRRPRVAARRGLNLDTLDPRVLPACTAFFDPATQALAIVGTFAADGCTIATTAAGEIRLDGKVTGATLANTKTIQITTADGNDTIVIDQAKGILAGPDGNIKITIDAGGPGHDLLRLYGTNNADTIDLGMSDGIPLIDFNGDGDAESGGDGNDRLFGGYGNDLMRGNNGHDKFWGWHGNDTMYGGAGRDEIDGEGGQDYYYGGTGNDDLYDTNVNAFDLLHGEAGSDTFYLADPVESVNTDFDLFQGDGIILDPFASF